MDLTQQRIVVTGGGGFLGGAVLDELERAGAADQNVLAPRRKDHDLTNESDVARMYAEMKPTVVIHLAAEVGGIGANQANPGRFFHANLAMGLHLIEHARLAGVQKFVQMGTVCAYPKLTPVPFREDDLWAGYPEETNAPYGIAKKALLVMLQSYRQQYGLCGIFLMPANLYGPNDNFDLSTGHVIPSMIRKFVEARDEGRDRVRLWGSGSASREFLYVEDCARGIVQAVQRYDGAEPVNLGSGCEVTIRDLAEKIKKLVGFDGDLVWDKAKPDGQPRRQLDTSRAEREFAFRADVSLDDGLKRTIDWYRGSR